MEKTSKLAEKAAHSMAETAETLADTLVVVMDKLAGKQSDVKLSFEDLTLELPMMKVRLNGAIVLDIVYAKEAQASDPTKLRPEAAINSASPFFFKTSLLSTASSAEIDFNLSKYQKRTFTQSSRISRR
jgi:hypothetical protein